MLRVLKQDEEGGGGAAVWMQDRLGRMTAAERTKLYAFMETSDAAHRLMTYVLGATSDELDVLLALIEADLWRRRNRRSAITINGIRLDPATAERVAGHPGSDLYFDPVQERRFDEHLYKMPEGLFFIMRPLAPDEAQEWLVAHDDTVLLSRMFPAEDD